MGFPLCRIAVTSTYQYLCILYISRILYKYKNVESRVLKISFTTYLFT